MIVANSGRQHHRSLDSFKEFLRIFVFLWSCKLLFQTIYMCPKIMKPNIEAPPSVTHKTTLMMRLNDTWFSILRRSKSTILHIGNSLHGQYLNCSSPHKTFLKRQSTPFHIDHQEERASKARMYLITSSV
jgi:hypothetical protein